MKLKEGFITQEIEGEQIMISVGSAGFAGLVRSNRTAAFIVEQLKAETTKEAIADALAQKYDVPGSVLTEDIERILEKLRSIGALDE